MTPAIERLLQLAEVARTRIQSLSPVADALVYELGEAIREVEEDTVTDAAPDLLEALKHCLGWIDNWAPDFTQDDAWPEYERAFYAAIAKADRRRENGE